MIKLKRKRNWRQIKAELDAKDDGLCTVWWWDKSKGIKKRMMLIPSYCSNLAMDNMRRCDELLKKGNPWEARHWTHDPSYFWADEVKKKRKMTV
jgi:hypothetical protein